jgi:hypothetical protein
MTVPRGCVPRFEVAHDEAARPRYFRQTIRGTLLLSRAHARLNDIELRTASPTGLTENGRNTLRP